MSAGRNGHSGRIRDLDAARSSGASQRPADLAPNEVWALIDEVFRSYGLDPVESTDSFGWRHLSVGSAKGQVAVVTGPPEACSLLVLVPLLELPRELRQFSSFFTWLLESNHARTLSARFSIQDDTLYVSLSRPSRGLDVSGVDEAIRTAMRVADLYHAPLREGIAWYVRRAHPDTLKLPNIKITPKEAQTAIYVLSHCDSHAQEILCYLMEQWQIKGHEVRPRGEGIGLEILLGSTTYSLGGIRRADRGRPPLVILGWESLRQRKAFPGETVDEYQSRVTKTVDLKTTESTAHIEITEAFGRASAKRLIDAMHSLAMSARPELEVEEPFQWDPDLPELDIKVGRKTLAGIQDALQACEPRVQQMYAILIEGWSQANGTVQCTRPGRIYLKLETRQHWSQDLGRHSHKFNLAVLAAPKRNRGPTIDIASNLATSEHAFMEYVPDQVADFEAVVSNLPGFVQQGTVTRLVIDDAFEPAHATKLLEAMLALKTAGGRPG